MWCSGAGERRRASGINSAGLRRCASPDRGSGWQGRPPPAKRLTSAALTMPRKIAVADRLGDDPRIVVARGDMPRCPQSTLDWMPMKKPILVRPMPSPMKKALAIAQWGPARAKQRHHRRAGDQDDRARLDDLRKDICSNERPAMKRCELRIRPPSGSRSGTGDGRRVDRGRARPDRPHHPRPPAPPA